MENTSQKLKFGIFEIPTKEGRLFANKKETLVSELYDKFDDELKATLESFQEGGYYDELVSGYSVKSVLTHA